MTSQKSYLPCNKCYIGLSGWQRKPDGKVREEKDPITPATLYMRYVKNVRPVVMREALKGAEVLGNWEEDSYLKERLEFLKPH